MLRTWGFLEGNQNGVNKATRNTVYRAWTDAFVEAGDTGALYWILSGRQDDATLYPDYDGFTDFTTDGRHGLRVGSTGATGTSTSVALQVGPSYTWCQSTWGWSEPCATATVNIDLTTGFSCDPATLTDVRGIFVWFSAGTFDVDYVRAE